MPAMETLSSTAEAAPSIAASATASRFPVNRPKTRDSTTIPVQIQVIAIVIPPVFVTDTRQLLKNMKRPAEISEKQIGKFTLFLESN